MQICPLKPPLNHAIELVAGIFAPDVRLIWSGDRAAEYLTAPDARRHVWHTCLASEYGNFSIARDGADFVHSRLTSMKAKDLIVQAYGVRPRGIVGVLRRLGAEARAPEIYRMIVSVMEKEQIGAKLLMHIEQPTDAVIETLALLPAVISKHTVEMLTRYPSIEPEDLALFVWTAERLYLSDGSKTSVALMQASDPIKALLDYLVQRPFPDAPWAGTELLRPIQSANDLMDIARRFKNCLRPPEGYSEVLKVMNGLKYFYEWSGKEPAAIDLVRLAGVGWYVHDVQGPGNVDISHPSRMEIARAFSGAQNICATRLTVRAKVYPCGVFWGEILRGFD